MLNILQQKLILEENARVAAENALDCCDSITYLDLRDGTKGARAFARMTIKWLELYIEISEQIDE